MSHSAQNNEFYKYILRLGVVAYTCHPDTQETKADRLWVPGQLVPLQQNPISKSKKNKTKKNKLPRTLRIHIQFTCNDFSC